MLEEWPAAERNKQPILEVLQGVLPRSGTVLEIASGTGQHIAHFAAALPTLMWQPSDCSDEHLVHLQARQEHLQLPNVLPALRLDVTRRPWAIPAVVTIYNANMIHISPWETTLGLFGGAAEVLAAGALLITYGPYSIGGVHVSQSNADFDASLKRRNPSWGVRDLHDVSAVAAAEGFALQQQIAMPANNFTLVWVKQLSKS